MNTWPNGKKNVFLAKSLSPKTHILAYLKKNKLSHFQIVLNVLQLINEVKCMSSTGENNSQPTITTSMCNTKKQFEGKYKMNSL